mmetsp:Transcript_9760/g.17688  ORF Transcript_9760/g.17688 Transcript_9760/m.17688 type:complete len:326 (+) Transcript_9760:2228-3205(+)
MLRDLLTNTELLHELNGKVARVSHAAPQPNAFRGARAGLVGQSVRFHDPIDHVLRHLAIRRPLSPRDEGYSRVGILGNDVISRYGSPGRSVGVGGERAETLPRAEDVGAPYVQAVASVSGMGQVFLAFVKEPLDLFLRRSVGRYYWSLAIGGAHERLPLPRQEEQKPPIRSINIQHPHPPRAVIPWKHDVRSRRCRHGRFAIGILYLSHVIREWSSREYDGFGVHIEGFAREVVSYFYSNGFAGGGVGEYFDHFGVVRNARTVFGGRERDVRCSPGVVMRPFVEDGVIISFFGGQLWKFPFGPTLPHNVRGGARKPGHSIVELEN